MQVRVSSILPRMSVLFLPAVSVQEPRQTTESTTSTSWPRTSNISQPSVIKPSDMHLDNSYRDRNFLYIISAIPKPERTGITAFAHIVLLLSNKAHCFCLSQASHWTVCSFVAVLWLEANFSSYSASAVFCNVKLMQAYLILCLFRSPIKCGSVIRLTHLNTNRNLHSHHFQSPLSHNLEVSAFGENGEGDEGTNYALCFFLLLSTSVNALQMSKSRC